MIENSTKLITNYYQSPLGLLEIEHDNSSVYVIRWSKRGCIPTMVLNPLVGKVSQWLDCYFSGQVPELSIELTLEGTDFQRRVWGQMIKIAPGTTKTYGEVATLLNSSARAVGGACRANPIVIIVPCHRIVAANSLGGYSGKIQGLMLDRKIALLACDKELSR